MRTWLYRADQPAGQIFEDEDAALDAEHDGWVDSPAKMYVAPPPAPEPNPDDGKDITDLTVPQARAVIEAEDDPTNLNAILAQETGRERGPRKGVMDAIAERVQELEEG